MRLGCLTRRWNRPASPTLSRRTVIQIDVGATKKGREFEVKTKRYPFGSLILPHKMDQLRQLIDEIKGSRKQEFEELHRRFGISRLEIWLIRTADGPLVMGTFEAENEHAMGELGASGEPFALWLNDQIREVYGPYIPDDSGDPATQQLLDWSDTSADPN